MTDLTATGGRLRVDAFTTPPEFRSYVAGRYGSTLSVHRHVASRPDGAGRTAALDAALDGPAARFDTGGGATEWEYLVVTARRI